MNDFEIDKALALAIKHKENDIGVYGDGGIYIRMFDENDEYIGEKPFNHKDPAVILPIVIEKKLSIQFSTKFCWWFVNLWHQGFGNIQIRGKTYEKCAALAVIELAKEGRI